jgi:ribosomal protein S12 methylthiotransferase accessory factor
MEMIITFPGGKRVDARFGEFTIQTDQAKEYGGDESAPAPFSLFLASLGTCAGIFVLGFCQNRNLPTDGIRLIQENEFDPESGHLKKVSIQIQIPPEFPEKYRDALVRVADKCSVKKTIMNPPEFLIQTQVVR